MPPFISETKELQNNTTKVIKTETVYNEEPCRDGNLDGGRFTESVTQTSVSNICLRHDDYGTRISQ